MDKYYIPLFLAGTILFVIFVFFIFSYMVIYARRQRIHEQEKAQLAADHQKSILNARLEEEERFMNRLSKEIHSYIGQKIDLTRMNLKAVLQEFPQIDRKKTLTSGLEQLEEISTAMQTIGYSLSSDYIRSRGLGDVLTRDLDYIKTSGGALHTSLSITTGYQTLDPTLELIIYRIAQDVLQNAAKHARCKELTVELRYEGFRFMMIISDDGCGFDSSLESMMNRSGFRSMRQRAELLAGALFVQATKGGGCRVTLSIDDVVASAMRLKAG